MFSPFERVSSIWVLTYSWLASFGQVADEEVDEGQTVPVIYEDDSSEESEELETDEDDNDEAFEGFSDIEDINDMMSE